jgi:hypothetical protein
MEGGGIWWQGASVAEKEVARGRSSRGLLILRSFCSIVCSLVAGSSGSRALAGFFCTGDRERVLASRREARANTARFGQSDVCNPCVQQRQYREGDSIDVRLWSNIEGSFGQLNDIAFECISVVAFTNKQRLRRKKKARSFRTRLVPPFFGYFHISDVSSPRHHTLCLKAFMHAHLIRIHIHRFAYACVLPCPIDILLFRKETGPRLSSRWVVLGDLMISSRASPCIEGGEGSYDSSRITLQSSLNCTLKLPLNER